MFNDWHEEQEYKRKKEQDRRERERDENQKLYEEYDARRKICLYFLTVCTGAFTFLAGAIFYKQADLFDYKWLITYLIICIILTVVFSLLTIKMQYGLLSHNRIHHYLATILRFSFSFKFKDIYVIDNHPRGVQCTYRAYFTFANRIFIAAVVLFLLLFFSLLFTDPAQKITEQPITTATQAKTSNDIRVIPKNCGQPLIPSLIYC